MTDSKKQGNVFQRMKQSKKDFKNKNKNENFKGHRMKNDEQDKWYYGDNDADFKNKNFGGNKMKKKFHPKSFGEGKQFENFNKNKNEKRPGKVKRMIERNKKNSFRNKK
jgi:hypothetical protein